MNNMQRSFKAKAKLDGAKIGARNMPAFANGGEIDGPGDGTSDSITAKVSNGEYILPADTVDAIGVDNLDAMKDATHAPAATGARGMPAFANGGMVRLPTDLPDLSMYPPAGARVPAPVVPPAPASTAPLKPLNLPSMDLGAPTAAPAPAAPPAATPPKVWSPRPPSANAQADIGPTMGRPDGMQAAAQRLIPSPAPAAPVTEAPAAPTPAGARPQVWSPRPGAAPVLPPAPTPAAPVAEAAAEGRLAQLSTGARNLAGRAGTAISNAGGSVANSVRTALPETINALKNPGQLATDARALAGAAGERVAGARALLNGGESMLGKVASRAAGVGVLAKSVYDGMDDDSTARYAKRFAADEPTGDGSAGDIAKFAALRAGGFASDAAANFAGIVGLGDKVRSLYADHEENSPNKAVSSPVAASTAVSGPQVSPTAQTPYMDSGEAVNNAERFGLPLATQRDAPAMSGVGLRGGFQNENLTTDPTQVNANLRATANGLRQNGGTALVSGLDGGDKIYASAGQNGGITLTGTGDGSAAKAYENSDQYKQGVARAQQDKDLLAQYQDSNKEQGLRDAVLNARAGQRGAARQNLADYQAEKLQANQIGSAQNIARGTRMADVYKLQIEQQNKSRDFGLRQDSNDLARQQFGQTQQNTKFTQGQQASNLMQKELEGRFGAMTANGRPVYDAAAVSQARQGLDAAVAKMGVNYSDLDSHDKEQLLAGSELIARIKQDGSNFNPFKPDYLKTMNPADLIGMARLPNGDAKLRNGDIIPSRYIDKEDADRVTPGTPTNKYESLFQGKK